MYRTLYAIIIVAALSLIGCAAKFEKNVKLDPTEPIRIAVLPFYQVDDNGAILPSSPDIFFVDNLPGVSKKLEDPPPVIVQKLVEEELQNTRLELVSPGLVRGQLVHHGFVKDREYDFAKIRSTNAEALCELLSCDALLYGEITEWDRSYYVVESVSTVGFDLKLRRASDDFVLFSATSQDSDSRGLSKGPTGYTSLAVEPIKGLDSEIIADLAKKMVSNTFEPLRVENLPEFSETPAPWIIASSHDAASGQLNAKQNLTVLMFGTPKQAAFFSIGDVIRNVPMTEVERGHYTGEYFPLVGDSFAKQPVFVSLTDRFGRTTRQEIGLGNISRR